MSNTGIKRPRSTNFSLQETECIVQEIENKRTDAVTWKQKERAWEDLTKTFNTLTAGNRTDKMLKVKYDGIKRTIKQKHHKAKSEQFKTGGGIAEVIKYTPWEEKLQQIISLSVEGLPSENDCDEVKHFIVEHPEPIIIEDHFDENECIMNVSLVIEAVSTPTICSNQDDSISTENITNVSNWQSCTPAALRTPTNKKLRTENLAIKNIRQWWMRECSS